MMSKKSPQLRFEGFTDDWEERKLGEHTSLITKGTTPKDKSGNGTINFVKVENISNGVISSVSKISEDEHENYLKRSKLEDKDVLFSIAGTLGRTAVVDKSILPANTNQALAIIRGYDFDTYFLTTTLNGHVVAEFVRKNPTVGAQPNLSLEQVGKLIIGTPCKIEQNKIGTFFKQLDDFITLHQRKLDLLKEQKKGYLQKMFPKNGAKVPELRFAGFADDWEERKLGEVFNQTVEYINPNEANLELWSVTVERGLTPKTARYNREALVKKNDKFKVVHDGDIVYNPMNLTIGAVGFNKSEKSVAVSGYYVTMNMNSGFNNSYFQTWLKSENAIKQYKLYATGSLIEKQRVQFPALSLIKSYIPTFEEQQKIGSFFKQLDETIALHQRKLDLLKEQKKGFLQKMFV